MSLAAALATLLLSTTPTSESVFQPGAKELERFRSLFTQGETLYQQGEYGAAILFFRAADAVRPTPEVAFDLAKCHEKLNDSAFATLYYRLYLRRSPNAKDALDVAEKVGTALSHAESEGRGFLELFSTGGADLVVNQRKFPEGPVALFLPPGEYEVNAQFPSGSKTFQAQIRTGKTSTVHFEPMPPPLLSADGTELAAFDTDEANSLSAKPKTKPLRYVSYLTAGVGVVSLGVGTVFGVMASGAAGQLQTNRNLNISQATALANQANTQGALANVLWAVGGVAVAAGVLMFVFSMPEPGMSTSTTGASP